LQAELSDAKFEIVGLKTKNEILETRVEELENKTETQELKIDQLEQTIDEKIIENEMQKMKMGKKEKTIQFSERPSCFYLNDDELAILSQYG